MIHVAGQISLRDGWKFGKRKPLEILETRRKGSLGRFHDV